MLRYIKPIASAHAEAFSFPIVWFFFNKDDLVKSQRTRHSCASRSPDIVPVKAGNQYLKKMMDSPHQVRGRLRFCGMTKMGQKGLFTSPSKRLQKNNRLEKDCVRFATIFCGQG